MRGLSSEKLEHLWSWSDDSIPQVKQGLTTIGIIARVNSRYHDKRHYNRTLLSFIPTYTLMMRWRCHSRWRGKEKPIHRHCSYSSTITCDEDEELLHEGISWGFSFLCFLWSQVLWSEERNDRVQEKKKRGIMILINKRGMFYLGGKRIWRRS